MSNNTMPGTYILVIRLDRAVRMAVGRLGTRAFRAGYYLYVGSALNGLSSRVARHLRREKRVHWHIDYLLQMARVVEVWSRVGPERLECAWAATLSRSGRVEQVVRGFGSSDCGCWSHLFFCADKPGEELMMEGARRMRLVDEVSGAERIDLAD